MAKTGFFQENTVVEETGTSLSETTPGGNNDDNAKSSFYSQNQEYETVQGLLGFQGDITDAVTAAEAAQAAAEAAQAAAETAEGNAETAEANAETAETNAETAQAAAAVSAAAAAASATAADGSADDAAASAAAAASSASDAANSASQANVSALAASADAEAAGDSADAAAESATDASDYLDQFTDLYLGIHASNPTTDNDGDSLDPGALYYNSVSEDLRIYNGSGWVVVAELTVSLLDELSDVVITAPTDGQALTYDSGNWINSTPIQTFLGLEDTPDSYTSQALKVVRVNAGATAVEFVDGTTVFQPLDSDLTSWAGVTRASGFDTFATTPSLANLGSLLTDDASGAMTFLTTPSLANFGSLLTDDASGLITFMTTPSSANLKSLVTDETGSGGSLVFATAPTLSGPNVDHINISSDNPYIFFTDTDTSADGAIGMNNATGTMEFYADYANEVGSSSHVFYVDTALKFTIGASQITAAIDVAVPDDAYAVGWNGSANVPTKNAVYDKIESLSSVYQPLDSDLTSWAGVTRASGFDTFVATPSLSNLGSLLTNEATGLITFMTTPSSANLASLVTDDVFSLSDIELGALSGLTSAADKVPYFTGSGTAALADLSSAMRTFMTTPSSANFASLVSDDAFSLADAELGAIAGLTSAADKGIYFTGSGTAATFDLSSYGRTLANLADETALEALLDTLPNLTSIQGFTVTFADAGFDVLTGWDDSAAAHKNFALADLTDEASPASGDYLLIYGAEGDLRKANWSTLAGGSGATTSLDNLSGVAINAALLPGTSDSIALGSTTKQWSDLFLGGGGVINWDNGDAALTHSSDTLTLSGANGFKHSDTAPFWQMTNTTSGAVSQMISNSATTGALTFVADRNAAAAGSFIGFSVDNTGGTYTCQFTDVVVRPGTDDATALGDTTHRWSDLFLAEGGVINWDNGDLTLTQTSNDLGLESGGLVVGNPTRLATFQGAAAINPALQVVAVGTAASSIGNAAFSSTATTCGGLYLAHSRGATIGSYTVVNDDDVLGAIRFEGSDGTDFARGATIFARVQGTPGAGDMPTELVFATSADGSETATERMSIGADGIVVLSAPLPVASGGTGQTTEAEALGEMTQALSALANSAIDYNADYLPAYDGSADTGKKVILGDVAPYLFKNLATDLAGQNTSSNQGWFQDGSDALTLAANTTYRFSGLLHLSRSAGTTSHTTSVSIFVDGAAVFASLRAIVHCSTGDTAANAAMNATLIDTGSTQFVVKVASTSATEQIYLTIEGTVRLTTGGGILPCFKYSAAPGGIPTIKANSYFECTPIGTDLVVSAGTWT